jgi:hypothetical protein
MENYLTMPGMSREKRFIGIALSVANMATTLPNAMSIGVGLYMNIVIWKL